MITYWSFFTRHAAYGFFLQIAVPGFALVVSTGHEWLLPRRSDTLIPSNRAFRYYLPVIPFIFKPYVPLWSASEL
jgi:hypothetical protein